MKIVFTYYPIQNNNALTYLMFSIANLNRVGIVPVFYSDKNYFEGKLNVEWRMLEIEDEFKKDNLWSYPKLKVLSLIDFPFIHLDNDLIIKDYNKLLNKINPNKLNLGYKHYLNDNQLNPINYIWKKYYYGTDGLFELNNTCIIGSDDYIKVNNCYKNVLKIINNNIDFFYKKFENIPPITLNQQYVSLFFTNNINYICDTNPEFDKLDLNGFAHISDKKKYSIFNMNPQLI